MALIDWNDALSVGVGAMDHQHKKLVDMVNRFYDAMHHGKGDELIFRTLRELAEYTRTHFTAEEALMRNVQYPHLPAHQELHANLVSQVATLLQDVQAGKAVASVSIATFLKDWLINHIGKQDREYGRFIQEQHSAPKHRPSAENTHTVNRQHNSRIFHGIKPTQQEGDKEMARQTTVGQKITGGFVSILVLTIILGAFGILQVQKIDAGLMDLANTHVPLLEDVAEVDSAAANQDLAVSLYVINGEEVYTEEFSKSDQAVDEAFADARKLIQADEELVQAGWLSQLDEMSQKHDSFVAACRGLINAAAAGNSDHQAINKAADVVEAAYRDFMGQVDAFVEANRQEMQGVASKATGAADTARLWMMVLGITTVLLGAALSFFITRSVVSNLKHIIAGLSEGAEQVTSAAQQVSAASQSLAEGATEQAAGLQETSSSLEEMASQTRQNSENAQQANALSTEAKTSADRGAEAMDRMNQAIQEIQKSSDETAKIIKVIDEIAFQTNLLALNAAVEAARAGEAGKGFAVVAEEVRNLAMRSAEAAKNTSEMIEGSVKNAQNGVQIAEEVTTVLNEIVTNVSKTTELIGEIAAASQEQSQGIDQVNQAVSQMDKVTQANAANAEESASAAEELNAQAEELNRVVGDLSAMVGGGSRTGSSKGPRRRARGGGEQHLPAGDRAFHQIAGGQGPAEPTPKPAHKAIPLTDDEGFDAFNS